MDARARTLWLALLVSPGCAATPATPPDAKPSPGEQAAAPAAREQAAAPAAPEQAAAPAAREQAAAPSTAESGADDERCRGTAVAERLEVRLGATTISASGHAVAFRGSMHDQFEGGHSDERLELVFQGVMEDGSLTPSALSWHPSAFAEPRWVFLSMSLCVRLVEPGQRRAVIELFRPEI